MCPKIKIFFVFLLSFLALTGFSQRKTFINYSLDEGLPQSTVISIYQDHNRNIWLGTQSGLCKFDGREMTIYDTRDGMIGNHVTVMLEDSKSRFWFGHRYNGLSLLVGGEFEPLGISSQRVSAIMEDVYGNIWIGTYGEGILILPNNQKPEPDNFIRIKDTKILPSLKINDFLMFGENELWVAAWDSFYTIGFQEDINVDNFVISVPERIEAFKQPVYSFVKKNKNEAYLLLDKGLVKLSLSESKPFENIGYFPFANGSEANLINKITIGKDSSVWGTTEKGVFKFDDGFRFFTTKDGLPMEEMNAIMTDVEGNIWIGSTSSGAFKYIGDKFSIIDQKGGLQSDIILSLTEDKQGRLWICTEKGVSYFDGRNVIPFQNKYGLEAKAVEVVFCDSYGNIWFGTFDDSPLIRYNPTNGRFKLFTEANGLISNSILTIAEDKNRNIWFATLGLGASCYTYANNGQPEKIGTYSENEGLSSDNIWVIQSDRDGNLWFGCDNAGLTKYDGKSFISFNDKDGLTNSSPGAITHDSKNNIWVGSIGGGVFKYDGHRFTNYTVADGLSSDSPFSIVCDDKDIVWVGTNSGIDRLDPVTEKIKHYGKHDGFLGIENNQNSVCRSHDGILWFGTMKGVVRFDPSKDKPNVTPAVTVIKKIKLFHSDFDYSLYSGSINLKTLLPEDLVLPYNKNHLTFEFVGVSMISSDRVRYKYMLEGFDEGWNPLTASGVATYTNTPPGQYAFKVKSSNSDGVWNDYPVEFHFTVLPPFWKTWWFLTLAGLFVFSVIYLIYYIRLRNIKSQKVKLQKLVDEKTKELSIEAHERKKAQEKAEKADKLKTTFLANMSHEIRTPVSAIIGFSDLLKDGGLNEEEKEQYLGFISRGGQNLLNLINDIIDISKIEAGQIRIEKEDFRLNSLLSEIYTTFLEEKNNNGKENLQLKLVKGIVTNDFKIHTDPFRLQQILVNLLSNALKFTEEGYIEFGYSLNSDRQLLFFVRDTGVGIPAEMHEVIFDRFRQVEESYTKNKEGTGLGLAISRKLTELLGGKIWVEANENKGSSFYFRIPMNGIHSDEEMDDLLVKNADNITLEGKTILVVEDEDSNYVLLDKMLKTRNAEVIIANNGKTAIDIISKNGRTIDLILMDIKMPIVNGYEATKKIKEIKEGIPIIAQTAFNTTGEKERCLAAGFDDFIAKPFDKETLLLKINKWT
jgi:signal transduction histidine kinase/ligand-binding sensor domain-containing protein/CheY-like chemotaxis protein